MQGRCTVQKNWMLLDYLLKYIPYLRSSTLNLSLCRLDVLSSTGHNQLLHNKWLKQL